MTTWWIYDPSGDYEYKNPDNDEHIPSSDGENYASHDIWWLRMLETNWVTFLAAWNAAVVYKT